MNKEQIQLWLDQKLKKDIALKAILGSLSITFGIIASYISFWLIYIVFYICTSWLIDLPNIAITSISLLILILIFIGNSQTSDEYLSEYSFSTGTASDKIVHVYIPGQGYASNINPLAPDSMHSFAKIITSILYIAPKMIVYGINSFRKIHKLSKLNKKTCSLVISLIYQTGQKVSFQMISSEYPDINLQAAINDLNLIDGALFLPSQGPSINLSTPLKEEIATFS